VPIVLKSGSLNLLEPQGLSRSVTGLLYLTLLDAALNNGPLQGFRKCIEQVPSNKMHIIKLGFVDYLSIFGEYGASVIGLVFISSILLVIILASISTSRPHT
jgi:hypothetical protein